MPSLFTFRLITNGSLELNLYSTSLLYHNIITILSGYVPVLAHCYSYQLLVESFAFGIIKYYHR